MSVELFLPSRLIIDVYNKGPELLHHAVRPGSVGLVLALFVATLWYRSTIRRFYLSSFSSVPYPKSDRTLLGHLVKFLREPWGFPLVKWQQTIPTTTHGFYRIFLGPSDYLVPMTPKALAVIMNDPNTFPKTAAVREGFIATLGHGVVSTVGAVHRKQRKLLVPIFGLERNRRLVPQMWTKASTLCETISRTGSNAADGSVVVDIQALTLSATLDVIGVSLLGVDFDCQRQPDQPILKAFQAVLPLYDENSWLETIFWNILPVFIPPRSLFKFPLPRIRTFNWGTAMLRSYCTKQVRKRKQQIVEAPEYEWKREDVLSAMIASGVDNEQELVDHLLTFLAAGHESTAITLAWALFELARRPQIQDRLRSEVLSNLEGLSDRAPSREEVTSLSYLRCFVMEVLRLYPVFPSMMRESIKDVTVADLHIPRGTSFIVSPYAINRSQEIWGEDAQEFRVERWEQAYSGGAKSAQAFMSFSNGPRVCIGKELAILNLKS